MGNQIVIPASKDWWSSVLNSKNYYIKEQVQSGSLFLKFICNDKTKSENFLVKAYQSDHLSSIPNYKDIKKYFEILSKSDISMINYIDIIETPTSVFFIRRKFGQPLSDVVLQESSLFNEEKLWITYQLFVALDTLHKIDMFHGDLKPSNILYVPSGRVYIVDPAPYKPFMLDRYHPHYFYYFFANDSSSGCFLAPERVLGTLAPNVQMPISDLILADLFSLGCIIAFMYLNGEPLFSPDTARKYGKGEYKDELENTLSSINDKAIINLIKGLISHNPRKRKETFDAFFAKGFPSDFKTMNEKFFPKQDYFILNQKPNSNLYNYSSAPSNVKVTSKEFSEIISESSLLKGTDKKPVTVGTKLIYFNYFGYRSLKSRSMNDIVYIIDFIVDFTNDFDDEVKLMRVIPLFIQLLDVEIGSLRRKILFYIIQIFRKIKKIPSDMSYLLKESILPLFRSKFRKEGIALNCSFVSETEIDLLLFNQKESDSILVDEGARYNLNESNLSISGSNDAYFAIIAEFLPLFSAEIFRLLPSNHRNCIRAFNFLPMNSLTVFKIFSNSMKKVLQNGSSFLFYRDYSTLMQSFFFSSVDHKIVFMNIIIDAYSNAKNEDKPYFFDDLIEILPMIFDSICPNNKVNFCDISKSNAKAIDAPSITNSQVKPMSKSRPGLPVEWDGPECMKWEEFTSLCLQFLVVLLERDFIDESFTYAIAGIIVPLSNSHSEKIYALLEIIYRYFTPYAKQMPLFLFIKNRIDSFSGAEKLGANAPDAIKLQEKLKMNSSDRIKFANPLLTVPLVRKFKRLPLSPRFVQSKRAECECVTNIALDRELCVYVLNGSKLRYFKNTYSNEGSSLYLPFNDKVNELTYEKSGSRSRVGNKERERIKEKRSADPDGKIAFIDLLGNVDNCVFSQNIVIAYEGGRIDCVDMTKEYLLYSNNQVDSSRHNTMNSSNLSLSSVRKEQTKSRNQTWIDDQNWKRNVNIRLANKHRFQTVQLGYENKKDKLTSFCSLKKRCCLISGRWNGCIEILDIRASPGESGEGCFGFVGGGSASIPFKFESLVSLSASPVNDDFLYAGFASGLVTAIDLRVGLPVSETLTHPAFDVWPVAVGTVDDMDGLKNSCIAVYDGNSAVEFVSEPDNKVVQKIYGKSFIGTTYNGGIVLADDFSASYFDVVNKEDNVRLYDGSLMPIVPEKTSKERLLSLPDFDDGDLVIPDSESQSDSPLGSNGNYSVLSSTGSSLGEDVVDFCDGIEKQIRKSIFSVHMHKSPLKCITKFENLFATGDSTGFVNLWTICSREASKIIPTYT